MSHEREILFGVLASEHGFIGRDDLLAAFVTWKGRQHDDLGHFMVETRRLTPKERDAVERLVEQYDGTDSPALSAEVAALQADLRAAIAGKPPIGPVRSESTLPGDRGREGASSQPEWPRDSCAATRFQILRRHAQGGLGEVLAPSDRYSSPRSLAADVEQWLADERVSAYLPAWHERLAHWGRRHRRGVQGAVAVLAIVAVVFVGIGVDCAVSQGTSGACDARHR